MYIVAGLMKDAHQARGLIRALADAAFEREEIDMSGGPIKGLVDCGVPEGEAHVFAEGVRRGGVIVAVSADDEMEAEQAALLMSRHGAIVSISLIKDKLAFILRILQNVKSKVAGFPNRILMILPGCFNKSANEFWFYMNVD